MTLQLTRVLYWTALGIAGFGWIWMDFRIVCPDQENRPNGKVAAEGSGHICRASLELVPKPMVFGAKRR